MEELRILKDKYGAMLHGLARVRANQEAIKWFDELREQGWLMAHRYNLTLSWPSKETEQRHAL